MPEMTSFEQKAVQLYEKEDWPSLCNLLDGKFKVEKAIRPLVVADSSFKTLDELLAESVIRISNEVKSDSIVVVKHLFKALRNSMTFSGVNYAFITDGSSVLLSSYEIMRAIGASGDAKCIECTRMSLQFLINLLVGNPACSEKVWQIFSPVLQELIRNNTHSYYASALTYNIFHNNPTVAVRGGDVFAAVFDVYRENPDNEYLTFLLEHFVGNKEVNHTYASYGKVEHRILCLQMLQQVIKDGAKIINAELITTLSDEFKTKSDRILKTAISYLQEIEPVEVSSLADVLACLSSDETYLVHLQADKSLLINCVFLLRSMHALGRASQNEFTPIEKLSELENPGEDSESHPAFGFKAALIRLLGNLAWKNKTNQDEMRQLECIPLLLDCCNIDARNPFIMQWAIFAIRNVCEGNNENQRYIAKMNKQGAVSSATLHQMGLTLHNDGVNQLKIVPLELKK